MLAVRFVNSEMRHFARTGLSRNSVQPTFSQNPLQFAQNHHTSIHTSNYLAVPSIFCNGFAKLTEKERAAREREMEKKEREREKARLAKEKERERAQREREKQKEQKLKVQEKARTERERERAMREKEKERALKEKEREKTRRDREKEMEEKEKEREKKRKEKELDALKPKRSRSAFTFFVADKLPSVKEQHPNEAVPSLMKEVAAQWGKLTTEEKKVYENKAAEDKVRRQKEYDVFLKTLPPKRPPTAYTLFFSEVRSSLSKENPNATVTEIASMVGQKWNSLDQKTKDGFMDKARKLKEEYDVELQKHEKQEE